MHVTAAERPEFTPPPQPGLLRSVGLALLAHIVLLLALSWGVKWQRDQQDAVVDAELWSATPQHAAPKVETPPPPPPPPPQPQPQAVQPPPPPREPDIAVEQRKQREAQERARQEEAARQRELAERRREEQERKEEAAKKAAEEKRRQELAQKKAAEEKDKRRQEQAQERARQQEQERVAKLREENLRRLQGLANATGRSDSPGSAARSAGPSASYAGRLAALFRRNVVYPGGVETIAGNPEAEVQVKVSPTGTILSARLVKSSGNPMWDEAAVRAIERSERIPPDEDGRYVSDFTVGMRPKR